MSANIFFTNFAATMKKITLSFVAFCIVSIGSSRAETTSDEAFLDTTYKSLQDVILPHAQWKRSEVASVPKIGGFVVGTYKYDSRSSEHGGDGFGLRHARLYVDGTIMRDFKYRLQLEFAGSPHIKDAFVAWSHWKELEVKVGEFKRCFTFENPMNPWDVGTGDYSQLTRKFAGYGDRVGEASMGGRDLGLQVQGDAFSSPRDGHTQLHYALGVYNGQGINTRDKNRHKDFIGNLQWSPVRDLWIGAFGWLGNWVSPDDVTVDRNRYGFGVKYESRENNWSARAEYVRSIGHKASDYEPGSGSQSFRWTGGNKADAWYMTVGIPVWRWVKVYAKYDAYREYATWNSMHTIYSLSTNLQPHKNLMLQVQYNLHQEGTTTDNCYHQLWAQAYFRF